MPLRQHAAHGLLGNAKGADRGEAERARDLLGTNFDNGSARALAGVANPGCPKVCSARRSVPGCHSGVTRAAHSLKMNTLPTPSRTSKAMQWLAGPDAKIDRLKRALLSNVDGHRNVIELQSFARAIGLEPDVFERLRREGLIHLSN